METLPSIETTLHAVTGVYAQIHTHLWAGSGIDEATFIYFASGFTIRKRGDDTATFAAHRKNFRALVREGRLVRVASNPCNPRTSCYAPANPTPEPSNED